MNQPFQVPDQNGIACPRCGCCDLRVERTIRLPGLIRRIRYCRHCGKSGPRFVTTEHLGRVGATGSSFSDDQ